MQSDPHIIIRRTAAIGDVVASLCVVDKLIELGYAVEYQAHSDIHCVLRRHGGISKISTPNGFCHINLDNAYEHHKDRRTRHFADLFMASANSQLSRHNIHLGDPLNCTPKLQIPEAVKTVTTSTFKQYPKPWVFICPRSQSYFARTIPDNIWQAAAEKIEGTKFWLGMHPAPANCVDLHAQHFDNVINWLSVADMLVTVDTGPLHVAAALGIPIVAIGQASSPELHLTDQRDFTVLWPEGLGCLNCQHDACPINYYTPPCQKIDPERISQEVNRRLRSIFSTDVSAVVPIYKPDPNTLNKCLQCLIPQVDEIVVTAQADSLIPASILTHPKIKYVRTPKMKCGYSGNCNFGARHSNGKHLLLLNDDVFVHPGSVEKLKECMKPGVGLVSGLLYYGDGKTIYHAGKSRSPGQRGWGHLDYKHQFPSITQVTEMENVNGAMIMVDRRAFYDSGCQDEELPIFANDDALCLSMRQKGYKVLFTPFSKGDHLEHASIGKLDSITNLLNAANKVFHRKWGWYLEKNLYTIPGTF